MLGLLLGLYLTPIVRKGALRFGVLDRPDGRLKRHGEAVPYLGGVAVYLAFLLTMALLHQFEPRFVGLLLGCTMVAMLGLFDDLRVLTPQLKLIGQLLVVWVMFKSGIFIQLVALPLFIAAPLSVLWLVGITNGFNIIDVSDGLASGTAAVAAVAFAVIALLGGDTLVATTALALLGSLLGFLHYNRAPARIYLGDTGSLFIGFMLASLGLLGAYTRHNEVAALAPVLVLIVPILDTTLVSVARIARGMSPLSGSDDHFAIRLKARGWSAAQVAWFASGVGALGGATGVSVVLVELGVALALVALMGAVFMGLLLWLYFACPAPSRIATASARREDAA